MRLFRPILLILFLPLSLLAQPASAPGFSLSGEVQGLTEGSVVFLTVANAPTDTVAGTRLENGRFVLTGHLSDPNLYDLNFGSAQKKMLFFIGNDVMALKGDVDDLKTLVLTGSSSNNDFLIFQKVFNPSFGHLNEVGRMSNAQLGPGQYDSLARVYKRLVDSAETNLDAFIKTRPSSPVSAFAIAVLFQLSEDVLKEEKRLNALSPDVQNGYYGKILREQIATAKVGAIGTEAIDFTQTDTAGRPVTLSSFKGKYVLVDFWASWCSPCRMENPNVVSMYGKFRNKNFTILGVSLDRSKEPWIKAINDDHLSWTQVSDLQFWNNAVAVKYHVQSIPTNLLIDPQGKIVGKNLRGVELQTKLCELLGCN